ncbi:MAG: PBP1A family penicillin-binding protein [Nannocystis sp.]|uniref:penicillin-binding protein 1A n=1 Tax=Nannocystis sp. TaxID=1962667 RepID=UPI00242294FB|nr:PBP1A family penicillin-binding protein [Nannocystis sp.]MBK9754926.1 PBP1A family penicillin-binding protein [Nannocystis sp.]
MIGRRWRKILGWTAGLGLTGLALGAGGIAGVFWYYGRDIEHVDVSVIRDYRPPQVTRIVARDGTVLGEIFSQRRTLIRFEDIPKHVVDAFLAAEDADFYNHEGMDYFGMARAALSNIEAGELRQGASTITQQVVKNFLLSQDRTFERKIQELLLARRLEHALSKHEILELYLNDIFLGHGRYGIEEASRFYFGKSVRAINIGQAAILAALPKAPGRSTPIKEPARVKARQVYVLEQMVANGFAQPQEVEAAIKGEMELSPATEAVQAGADAQEFVDAAREFLLAKYGEERLDRLGATVITTVDLQVQAQARFGLFEGLVALDKRQGYGHKIKPVKPKEQAKVLEKGRVPLAIGAVVPVVIQARTTTTPADAFVAKAGDSDLLVRVPEGTRYDDPKLTHDEQFPAGGVTMVTISALAGTPEAETAGAPKGFAAGIIGSGPQAAVVVAEAKTGEIVAMIGGDHYRRGEFNRVLAAKRQPGSSFKPFIYGAALATEKFTAATLVSDSPEIYEKWKPTNFEADEYRGDIRLRVALTYSVNTIAIKLLDAIGFEAAHAFARAAGIQAPLAENLALALGVSEMTPRDLLAGYLTLARGGSYLEPTFIRAIDVQGEERWTPERVAQQTLRDDVVFVLTSMMTSVVQEGTGTGAKALKRPVAGKTGTSAEHRDAWFAGFTPDHVAVAWVGFDTPKKLGKSETGGRAALPIWLAAVKAATGDLPVRGFVPPASVQVRTIDKRTGLLAPTEVPQPDGTMAPPKPEEVMEEYFVPGSEPVDVAEPAALPAGDALLDLYGDGDEKLPSDQPIAADSLDPVPAPEPAPEAPPNAPNPRPKGSLPSVTDEPD